MYPDTDKAYLGGGEEYDRHNLKLVDEFYSHASSSLFSKIKALASICTAQPLEDRAYPETRFLKLATVSEDTGVGKIGT